MPSTIRFGNYMFRFPGRFVPNFGSTSPVIAELIDVDGGLFVGGPGSERRTIHRIAFDFTLRARTPNNMWAARSEVIVLQDRLLPLMLTPAGQTAGLTCMAKMTNLTIGHDGRDLSEWASVCNCVFTVADPRWQRNHFDVAPLHYDGSEVYDGSNTYAGPDNSRFELDIDDELVHTFNWPNDGTAVSYPRVGILNTAAGMKPGWTLRRLAAGVTDDRVRVKGGTGEYLVFDGYERYVALDGSARAGRAALRAQHPLLLRLLPGDNAMVLQFDSSAQDATLYARWQDAWY